MTLGIIITICLLLLLSYLFEVTAPKTRIPSVILLLLLGWALKNISLISKINIPDLTPVLPVLGTLGLILIVLEGSFELELNKSKLPLIGKSSIVAFIPMLIFSFGFAYIFKAMGISDLRSSFLNAIPFAVISSAITIPSAKNLLSKHKEFLTYESSLSDIFGVIVFNFIIFNENIGSGSFGYFFVELLIILVITVVSTIILAFLLSRIKHTVKFAPIILIIVLIYAISKYYHLPALIFILAFGVFAGNIEQIKHFSLIKKLHPEILSKEVNRLNDLTKEIAFMIRSLFFLVFGFLIQTKELLDSTTILWAMGITTVIYFVRYAFLKIFRLPEKPLLFFAPRGLITILLFLSIPANHFIPIVNKSLVIQVILLTVFIMFLGNFSKKEQPGNG